MSRERSPNRDKAKKIYLDAKGQIKLIDIAAKLGVGDSQVRKWKSQDKWDKELKATLPKVKSNVTKSKSNVSEELIAEEVDEVMSNDELTYKQQLFCLYYVKSFNATRAYQKAYGCNYLSAKAHGYQLLRNVAISKEITKLKQNKLNRAMLSEDDIFQKYIDIAFADISDFLKFGKRAVPRWSIGKDGVSVPVIDPNTGKQKVDVYSYVELNDSEETDTSVVSEVSEGKDGIKIKLNDKMKALQWLSDRMDLLPTNMKEKISIEKAKLDIFKVKAGVGDDIGECEGDGFIDALKGKVEEVWDDGKD